MAAPSRRAQDLLMDDKWDLCVDLSLRRVVYSTLAGAATGLVLFRSPTSRWAALAFGAGCGVGSAYTDCSRILDGHVPRFSAPLTAKSASAAPAPAAPAVFAPPPVAPAPAPVPSAAAAAAGSSGSSDQLPQD
ncbi:unnamed protein product [Closterium sp. Yama58-4]|nr:unnamed protein product [Closterium sp. Yama58-4]